MKTKHDFLLYLCVVMGLCMTITNTSAQNDLPLLPTQVEFLDSLYSSTGGANWREGVTGATYTIEQLVQRGVVSSMVTPPERPYINTYSQPSSKGNGLPWSTGEDIVRYNSIWAMDLSNMNLVGDLPDNMAVAQYQGVYVKDIPKSRRPRFKAASSSNILDYHITTLYSGRNQSTALSHINLSYNQLTGLPPISFYIGFIGFQDDTHILEVRLDHNKIREINWRTHESFFGRKRSNIDASEGIKILDLHQNDITNLSMSRLGFHSNWTSNGNSNAITIANIATRVRVDNNRLPMRQLIALKRDMAKLVDVGPNFLRKNHRYVGNANFVFEYLPQKPIGGDPTEITLAGGVEHTVSYVDRYTAGDNVYSWQLNGRDIPLSSTKDFTFGVSVATAGVYRCKITNPRLPDAELYTFDQSVFLVSTTNQAPTDFTFSATSIIPDFPEGFILGSFSGTDPDGDQLYYHLVDGEGDNGSFFMLGGSLLVTTEEVFPYDFKTSYTVVVEAYDIYGGKFTKTFTLGKGTASSVDFPTSITLSSNRIEENLADASIGKLTSVGATGYTFSLPSGVNDNDLFTVEGDSLRTRDGLDFETQRVYAIRVSANQSGVSLQRDLSVICVNANDPPSNIILGSGGIAATEPVGTLVGTLIAEDADASDAVFTFMLASGEGDDDNGGFIIRNDNELITNRVFAVSEEGQSKSIRVQVSDPGGATFEKILQIMVNEAPPDPNAPFIRLEGSRLNENDPDSLIGSLSVVNAGSNTYTFSLVSGYQDNALFTISNDDELRNRNALNFENKALLEIQVRATAGSTVLESDFSIVVNNLNEPPSALAFSNLFINNLASQGTIISDIFVIDPDNNEEHRLSLLNEPLLSINETNQLVVSGDLLALSEEHRIEVQVIDRGGLTYRQPTRLIVISESVVEPEITLSGFNLDENDSDSLIGSLNVDNVEEGDSYTFSLSGNYRDNSRFTISNDNELHNRNAINFEDRAFLYVRILATDDSDNNNTLEKEFTIIVNDINEPPTSVGFTNLFLNNQSSLGTVVSQVLAIDPDNNEEHRFEVLNNDTLVINGENLEINGEVSERSDGDNIEIQVRVTDKGNLSYVQEVTLIVVAEESDDPIIEISNLSVDENTAANMVIGTLSVSNGGSESFTYTLSDSYRDNGNFMISNNELRTSNPLNFEAKQLHSIQLVATGGELTIQRSFNVQVDDVNESPTAITFSNLFVSRLAPQGTEIGQIFVVDPDNNDRHTLEIRNASNPPLFRIDAATLTLEIAGDISTLAVGERSIELLATDQASNTYSQTATLVVVNEVLEAPEITLSQLSIDENQESNTRVGTLGVMHGGTNTFTYSLPVDTEFPDHENFMITGTDLLARNGLDYEQKALYRIKIMASSESIMVEKEFDISVINVNEPPTEVSVSRVIFPNSMASGEVIGDVFVDDPDLNDRHALEAADHSLFSIINNQLQVNGDISSISGEQNLNIQATDGGRLTYTEPITLFITEAVEGDAIDISVVDINENASIGTRAATLSVNGDSEGWTFMVDDESFSINRNRIEVAGPLTLPIYELNITGTKLNKTLIETVYIPVTPVNEPPTAIGLSNFIIDANAEEGSRIAKIFMKDGDGDAPTFTLVEVSPNFSIENNELKLITLTEGETSYEVTISASDGEATTEKTFTIYLSTALER